MDAGGRATHGAVAEQFRVLDPPSGIPRKIKGWWVQDPPCEAKSNSLQPFPSRGRLKRANN